MLDLGAVRLLHRHGSDYVDMVEREHGAADHDPERSWMRGARIFQCRTCAEEVVAVPANEEPGDLPERSA
jgi:hypothetical protein